jgi:hypothetical protein
VRQRDAPAPLRRVRGERARVVAVGAAFEAVEQDQAPRRARVAGEIDVDEVAVGRVPALPLEARARRRRERGLDRLQVSEKGNQ